MKARAAGDRSPLPAPGLNLVSSAGSRAPDYESGGRMFESCTRYQRNSGLAQLAEQRPPKPKVRGSTPWPGAKQFRRSQVVEGIWLQSRRHARPRRFESDRRIHASLAQRIGATGFYPAGRPFESVTRRQPCFPGSSSRQSAWLLTRRFVVRGHAGEPGSDQPALSRCGAVGSARDLGSRGRRFEPCHRDQTSVCLGVAVAGWQSRGL